MDIFEDLYETLKPFEDELFSVENKNVDSANAAAETNKILIGRDRSWIGAA